jgi:hypothetical protein
LSKIWALSEEDEINVEKNDEMHGQFENSGNIPE